MLTRAGAVCCDVCREQFSPLLRYGLWIMAEIAIIGSDIQEVIGSAIALLLLSRGAIPLWGGVLLSVALSFTMLLVERCGIRKLEALFGVLISIMVASFAVRHTARPSEGAGGVAAACTRMRSVNTPAGLWRSIPCHVYSSRFCHVRSSSLGAQTPWAHKRGLHVLDDFCRVPCGCCLVCR